MQRSLLRGLGVVLTAWIVGALLAAPVFAQHTQPVTPERYDIDVRFEPDRSFLHARATVGLRVNEKLQAIEFELNPYLRVLQVTDDKDGKLDFVRSGRLGSPKLSVRLADACDAGGSATLTFVYEGVLPRGDLDYITKDGILLRDESRWYPATNLSAFTEVLILTRLPGGWQTVTSRHPSLSFGLKTDWDKEVAATGARMSRLAVSSRSIVAAPASGWSCLEQAGIGDPSGVAYSIRLCTPSAFVEQGRTFSSKLILPKLWFEKILGSLAPPLLTMVSAFPGQRGAIGYSAPGFLVVSEDVVKYHGVAGWAPEFLPHEIAHQWFPIEVTLARPEDGWLAEGLAEYLAWRYLQEKEPEQARLMVQRAVRDSLEPEKLPPLSLGLKLFAQEPYDVAHKTLYQRGMLVFRALETVIGRSRVDASLRGYYKRFAGRSAGIADFRMVCEEIAQRDLGWFFDFYISGTEVPEITLRPLPSSAPNEYLGEIVVKNAPPEFQVRVELKFFTSEGAVENSVALRGEVTPISMNLPGPLQRVVLDPDLRILRWTEAARRNREQARLLSTLGELERSGDLRTAMATSEQALALDPDDLAANHQGIRFQMGRFRFRLKQAAAALVAFEQALSARSIEPMNAEFYRAWSRVYRSQILHAQGKAAAARAEAKAGLALAAPALDSAITWPEAKGKQTTARRELTRLAAPVQPAKRPQ